MWYVDMQFYYISGSKIKQACLVYMARMHYVIYSLSKEFLWQTSKLSAYIAIIRTMEKN